MHFQRAPRRPLVGLFRLPGRNWILVSFGYSGRHGLQHVAIDLASDRRYEYQPPSGFRLSR